MSARAAWLGALWPLALCGCSEADDVVFVPLSVKAEAVLAVPETAGLVSVPFELSAPSTRAVSAHYQLVPSTAQNDCLEPDFSGGSGTLSWPPGETVARVPLRVLDDELAEKDEGLSIVLSQIEGALVSDAPVVGVLILDDDRSALFTAHDFGAEPDTSVDQTAALQQALDAAAESGRGVVVLAPGKYDVTSVRMTAGTTLSGTGATLRRPGMAGAEVTTLALVYGGTEDAPPTLIEGLAIDGQRELQGVYQDYSQQTAALIQAGADPETPGLLRFNVEGVSLASGVGDGLSLGGNVDATLCRLSGYDLWWELIGATGGNSRIRARGVSADGSEGTTGLYFGGKTPGYEDSSALQVELEQVLLGTGDLELSLKEGSDVRISDLTMARAAFRIVAPGSKVTISDSFLMLGIPSENHNHFRLPHDVTISHSTLLLSEQIDEEPVTEEAERSLAFAEVSFRRDPESDLEPGEHRLLFDTCRFDLSPDVETSDQVYVLHSPEAGGSVIVRGSELGPGIVDWLSPDCLGCAVEP